MTTPIVDIEPVVAGQYRVEIETGVAAGLFEPTAGWQVVRIVRAADGEPEHALLRLPPGAMDRACHGDALASRDWLGSWSRERRVAVSATAGDEDKYLFCGAPASVAWQVDAAGREQLLLTVEGPVDALRRVTQLAVVGRFCRQRKGWSAQAASGEAGWVSGLDCIFNPDGRWNCAAEPVPVRLRDGTQQAIHVFTHDDDAAAQAWTMARAARYLAWFHLARHPWLDVAELLSRTQGAAALDEPGRDSIREAAPLEWLLRARLWGASAEGANALDALGRLLREARIGWHVAPSGSAGVVRCGICLWSEREGAARSFATAASPDEEVPAGGMSRPPEIVSGRLVRRVATGAHGSIVLGDVKYHEVTVELAPGWGPRSGVDDVLPAQRAARKAEALLPEDVLALGQAVVGNAWFRQFHRQGENFSQNEAVGRRWVLNEHGAYSGAAYNRYPPFDRYEPFDFRTVLSAEASDAGAWSVRPRRLLDPITRGPDGERLPLAAQISFDGGLSWFGYAGPVRVLKGECGIVLDAQSPCEITPPGVPARTRNLWYALIDQQARVRVTALVEGDERVRATASQGDTAWLLPGRTIQADRQLAYRSAAGALNVLRSAGLTDGDVDDRAEASALARRALDEGREYAFALALPGVRLDVGLGQRVWGLTGRPVRAYGSTLGGSLPSVRRIHYTNGATQTTRVFGE